jgi:hypothetical protein
MNHIGRIWQLAMIFEFNRIVYQGFYFLIYGIIQSFIISNLKAVQFMLPAIDIQVIDYLP